MSVRWITARPRFGVDTGKLPGNSVRIGLLAATLGLAWLVRDPTGGVATAGLFGLISLPWGNDDSEEPAETDAADTTADSEMPAGEGDETAETEPATAETAADEPTAA
ncbi:MAG: hypothetical protein J07HN4v3_00462, partial [Halonotius sp. J07HN4]